MQAFFCIFCVSKLHTFVVSLQHFYVIKLQAWRKTHAPTNVKRARKPTTLQQNFPVPVRTASEAALLTMRSPACQLS